MKYPVLFCGSLNLKRMIKKLILNTYFLFFLTSSFAIKAQTVECVCCISEYNQFDFWLGDWVVTNRKGEIVGWSKIQKLENNCLVSEKWRGTKEFSGRSYNYFDPEKKAWNQLWISNTGNILRLEGQFEKNKMVLTSPLQSGPKGSYKNQIVWTPKGDSTVTQEWLRLFEDDEKNDTLFFGVYHRNE